MSQVHAFSIARRRSQYIDGGGHHRSQRRALTHSRAYASSLLPLLACSIDHRCQAIRSQAGLTKSLERFRTAYARGTQDVRCFKKEMCKIARNEVKLLFLLTVSLALCAAISALTAG